MADTSAIPLSASMEDYLEAIFTLTAKSHVARAKDIGKMLKVGRSSVTGALRALADKELINYEPYSAITLTAKGEAAARDIVRKHNALKNFFIKVLAIPENRADAAACRMEHAVDDVILTRFIEFVDFVERCPRGGTKWIKGFGYYCDNDKTTGNCEQCVELVLDDIRSNKMTESAKAAEARTTSKLSAIKPGNRVSIVKIEGSGPIRRRLLDMGATAGTIISVDKVAPLGDPMEITIKGYKLTLRKQEAQNIVVEAMDEVGK